MAQVPLMSLGGENKPWNARGRHFLASTVLAGSRPSWWEEGRSSRQSLAPPVPAEVVAVVAVFLTERPQRRWVSPFSFMSCLRRLQLFSTWGT